MQKYINLTKFVTKYFNTKYKTCVYRVGNVEFKIQCTKLVLQAMCTACAVLHNVHCMLCIVQSVMCTVHIVQCAVHYAAHCAGLVDPAGRCQMAASSTTTGNNCQCHSACKDDNDDDAGGNHQMMMMMMMCRGVCG